MRFLNMTGRVVQTNDLTIEASPWTLTSCGVSYSEELFDVEGQPAPVPIMERRYSSLELCLDGKDVCVDFLDDDHLDQLSLKLLEICENAIVIVDEHVANDIRLFEVLNLYDCSNKNIRVVYKENGELWEV